MEKMEFRQIKDVSAAETKNRADAIREQVFAQLINSRIIEEFEEDLFEIFEDEDAVDKILDNINSLELEEQCGVLALPKSVRKKRIEFLKSKSTKNGIFDPRQFVEIINDDAKSNGFTIGFHASPYEVPEKEDDWTIDGTDFDDRDEMQMAYYSLDYKNIFRKNRGNYVYVVRAEVGDSSTHKRDTSNNWGRAVKLSVITRLSLPELDKAVEEITKEKMKKAA